MVLGRWGRRQRHLHPLQEFHRAPDGSTPWPQASTSGSTGEPLSSTYATIVDATVDNASNKYYLTLDFPDTLYYYYGAVIEYITTEPH